ncbi:MAG: chemotaxis protein CheW, partial [Pseudanabaenaceae cyanobacterium]
MSSYLQIALKHHIYGLPIDLVEEILLLPEITPIPDSPSDIIGIANLRGKALP